MQHFMNAFYAITRLVPTDIYPVQYGEEQCEGDHSFGPCVRSNYLLHYVYSGKGTFRIGNTEYFPHKGQMFLITPNSLAYYKADHDDPWLYRWIEFNGSMAQKMLNAAGLSCDMPVYTDDEKASAGLALLDIVQNGNMRFETLMQKFWAFLASFQYTDEGQSSTAAQEYIEKAESFIKINAHKKITVNDVTEYIGINRSYLTRLFQQYKNISPQQYILELKMNTAAQYIKNTDISIKEAAQSVGYFDTHVFNKAFKRQFNISPSKWRQKQLWEQSIVKDFVE